MSASTLLALSCGSDSAKIAQRGEGGAGGVGGEPSVIVEGGRGGQPGNSGGLPTTHSGGAPGMGGASAGGAGGERSNVAGQPSMGGAAGGDLSGGGDGFGAAGAGGETSAGGEAGAGSAVPSQTVYNTGVDDDGVVLPGGSVDPHYKLIESAESTLPGPDAIVTTNIALGYWVAQSDVSKWIAPSADQPYPGPPVPCNMAGVYLYRTTFRLEADQVATFTLGGKWAADNNGTDILLNDVSLGLPAVGYSPLSSFTISSGFVTGVNTLDFEVTDVGCPNGLRVELTANPT